MSCNFSPLSLSPRTSLPLSSSCIRRGPRLLRRGQHGRTGTEEEAHREPETGGQKSYNRLPKSYNHPPKSYNRPREMLEPARVGATTSNFCCYNRPHQMLEPDVFFATTGGNNDSGSYFCRNGHMDLLEPVIRFATSVMGGGATASCDRRPQEKATSVF